MIGEDRLFATIMYSASLNPAEVQLVRRSFVGLLTICMIAVLVACGASGNSGSTTTTMTDPMTPSIPYCLVKSQAPLVFCAGSDGGVAQGLLLKSKNSVMSGMAASRAVSVGSFQRVSIKRRYAV